MPDTILDPSDSANATQLPTRDIIRGALVESRHRWQHLLGLAVDLAFETNAEGRFVFIMPEAPLGWPRGALIGQPAEILVGAAASADVFNPFRPTEELRHYRAWLRCHDGGIAMITVSA